MRGESSSLTPFVDEVVGTKTVRGLPSSARAAIFDLRMSRKAGLCTPAVLTKSNKAELPHCWMVAKPSETVAKKTAFSCLRGLPTAALPMAMSLGAGSNSVQVP
mmetsp:Transcript_131839/g.256837  ORF Transcript_131839/g.256837 Transcript_131839/m.256837 type:complete len:104 (-) Transcript_131839:3-314(-)